jgi:hypothetical protein
MTVTQQILPELSKPWKAQRVIADFMDQTFFQIPNDVRTTTMFRRHLFYHLYYYVLLKIFKWRQLFLCLIKHHTVMKYGHWRVASQALNLGTWQFHAPANTPPGKSAPVPIILDRPEACVNTTAENKTPCPCHEPNLDCPTFCQSLFILSFRSSYIIFFFDKYVTGY